MLHNDSITVKSALLGEDFPDETQIPAPVSPPGEKEVGSAPAHPCSLMGNIAGALVSARPPPEEKVLSSEKELSDMTLSASYSSAAVK